MAEHQVKGKPKTAKKHPVMSHEIRPADNGTGFTSRTMFNAKAAKSKHAGLDTSYPESQEVVHENLEGALAHANQMLGGSTAAGKNPNGTGEPNISQAGAGTSA